jgi:hypothetical protein
MASSGTGGKYEGTLLMGLPSQPFEFVVENGVSPLPTSPTPHDLPTNHEQAQPRPRASREPHPPYLPEAHHHATSTSAQVMSFTNVGADQPIICDGFSSLPGATVGGQVDADPALGQTAAGADGGTTAAIVIVVIVCLCGVTGVYLYLSWLNRPSTLPEDRARCCPPGPSESSGRSHAPPSTA